MKMRKFVSVLLVFVIISMLAVPAMATTTGSIRDSLKKELNEDQVVKTIDSRAYSFVRQARILAGVIAVIFLVWFGYNMFTAGGDPQKYAMAKSKLVAFVIALFFIFAAESIVGGILKLLGAEF
jgi:cytochrome bd-type quinol oxidase subunit 2